MTITALLERLRQQGIELWVTDGRLRYRAPKGVMTPQLRRELAAHRADLIAQLQASPTPTSSPHEAPLSPTQQRLWFLEQMHPCTATYTIVTTIRMEPPPDASLLEACVHVLLRRHAMLRTALRHHEGEPYQYILPPDISSCWSLARQHITNDHTMEQWLAAEAGCPFDITQAPILRTTLINDNEHCAMFVLATHHVVADGWSLQLLLHELATLYRCAIEQHVAPDESLLPVLPLSFADYTAWQSSAETTQRNAEHLSYWLQQLADAPTELPLPIDYPRPPEQTIAGATYHLHIPPSLTAGLNTLSQRERTTLFTTLLAAFQILLFRYTQQHDVVVATAISHRTHPHAEYIVGPCSNTLLLRTKLDGEECVRDALRRVHIVVCEALEHQDVPFERVVEAIHPTRTLNAHPLGHIMFLLQHAPSVLLEHESMRWSIQPPPDSGVAKVDLSLILVQTEHGIDGLFEYSTDLFKAETIARMAGHFLTLLQGMVNDPAMSIRALPLLTLVERHALLTEWSTPLTTVDIPADICLHHLFECQAARTPDAIALAYADISLTYGELNAQANRLAHALEQRGARVGIPIAFCLEPSPAQIIAILAILKVGAHYIPLDPAWPITRQMQILGEARPTMLLTHRQHIGRFSDEICPCIDVDDLFQNARGISVRSSSVTNGVTADDPAYIIFTSGSTGVPKGVVVPHRSVCTMIVAQRDTFDIRSSSRILQCVPITFDVATADIFLALTSGAILDMGTTAPRVAGRALWQLLRERMITFIQFPPSILATLPTEPLPNLTTIVVGGEPSSNELLQQWAHGRTIWRVYGTTETAICTTAIRFEESQPANTIGVPLPGARVYVLDDSLQPVPIGVAGELIIGGEGVALGYLNDLTRTAERFMPDPFASGTGGRMYRTGDIVRWAPDGTLQFIGRRDEQVKIRGVRIELGEIESVLRTHPALADVAVVAQSDGPGDTRIIAYGVPRLGKTFPSHTDLHAFLSARLPAVMCPSAFIALDTIPMLPSGKRDRQRLPPPNPIAPITATPVPPRDYLEHDLLQLWEQVLGKHGLGIHDDFFECGGHSLLAVRLLEQIRRYANHDVSLAALFSHSRVAQMAQLLRTERVPSSSSLVPIQPKGTKTPFFCVHPLLGVVFPYYDLARHLGDDQPFYGLQAKGLDPQQAPHISIIDMARDYINAIRAQQPHGPYAIGGWSFGSLVAFEMAQQLTRQGETVELLALFDTPAPIQTGTWRASIELLLFLLLSAGLIWPYVADYGALLLRAARTQERTWPWWQPIGHLSRWLHHDIPPALLQSPDIRRMIRLLVLNIQLASVYHPVAYTGNVTLFCTGTPRHRERVRAGWQRLAHNVRCCPMPGNHYTLLRPPHVAQLAQELRICLCPKGNCL